MHSHAKTRSVAQLRRIEPGYLTLAAATGLILWALLGAQPVAASPLQLPSEIDNPATSNPLVIQVAREDREERRQERREARREERQENRSERRQDRQENRGENRQERRENRAENRNEHREDRGDNRSNRQENRAERREERQENRREDRTDRRDDRGDRQGDRGDRRDDRRDDRADRRDDRRGDRRDDRRDDRADRRDDRRDGRRGDRGDRRDDRRHDRGDRRDDRRDDRHHAGRGRGHGHDHSHHRGHDHGGWCRTNSRHSHCGYNRNRHSYGRHDSHFLHIFFGHDTWCDWNWGNGHCDTYWRGRRNTRGYEGYYGHTNYNNDHNGDITFYDGRDFSGRRTRVSSDIERMSFVGFNDDASSVRIRSGTWELCEDRGFYGYCIVVSDDVRDLGRYNMNNRISSVRRIYGDDNYYRNRQHSGYYDNDYRGHDNGVGFYVGSDYHGDRFEVGVDMPEFGVYAAGYNGSLEVLGGRWEVCENSHYNGRCTTVEGRYSDLGSAIGFGIGSIRRHH